LDNVAYFPKGSSLLYECCCQRIGSHELVSSLIKNFPWSSIGEPASVSASTKAAKQAETGPTGTCSGTGAKSKASPETGSGNHSNGSSHSTVLDSSPTWRRHLDPCFCTTTTITKAATGDGASVNNVIIMGLTMNNTPAVEVGGLLNQD
jgi:hypothetical protein